MAHSEQLLSEIGEGIKNTSKEVLFLLDVKSCRIIKTTRDLAPCVNNESDLIIIEPMLKDLLEIMEDFALEQDTEEIQEHLMKILNNRDQASAINNFNKALLDYPRSKKSWQILEKRWLKERAIELLDDYSNVGNP